MSEYIIFTDSACDLTEETLKEWGVQYTCLTFKFDDDDKEYSNYDLSAKEFYEQMQQGRTAKTSATNVDTFKKAFEPILKEGKDILYVGFSSGLSTTVNSGRIAAQELREEYPDRNVIVIDTLCASAGQGLAVYLSVQKKKEGATLEENAAYMLSLKNKICHWFTVDDLVYLKRGGRVSPTVAFVGGLLGIKPIMKVDDAGKLIKVSTTRGRKNSLNVLIDKLGEQCSDPKNATVFISHADCLDEVKEMEKTLKAKYGIKFANISNIGPVIGAHAGPHTMAFFFVGDKNLD